MGEERNEIINAMQNGFFNEGIYRINEAPINNKIETVVEAEVEKEVLKTNIPPLNVVSVAEEPEINISVSTKQNEPEVQHDQEIIAEYFGENKKGVAILVNYPDERWIYFKDKIILERILASIALTFDDVALINTHFYKPVSINELNERFNITKIVGFGVKDAFLKDLKREVPEKTEKVAVFLMNADLDEIAMNNDKKRLLWNNIKVMFCIK